MLSTVNEETVRLRTPRLRLDTWSTKDFPLLFALHAAPAVQIGYSLRPDDWTESHVEAKLLSFIKEQETVGVTKWKMSLHDGTFVGRAGWSTWEAHELEMGYAIMPDHHGFGYATEIAAALLADARVTTPSRQLVGFALIDNRPSRRVLEKVGMSYEGDRMIAGSMNAFYRAS